MSNGRTKYLWIGMILIHFFFLLYQGYEGRYFLVDSEDYIQASKNLWENQSLYAADMEQDDLYAGNYSRRPPLYPIFLLPAQVLGESWLISILLQNLCSLLAFGLFLKIHQLLYPDKELSYLFVIFLFLYPAQFIYANLIMSESLFQLLLCLSLYYLIKGEKEDSKRDFLLHAICLAAALLTKPVLYLLIPIHALYFLFRGFQKEKRYFFLVALLPIFVLFSYSWRNYVQTDYLHVSSVQNINLLQYPVTYVLSQEMGVAKADSLIDHYHLEARSKGSFKEEQEYWAEKSKEVLLEYPLTFLKLHVRGMFNFFLDPGRFDVYNFFGIKAGEGEGLMATFGKEGYSGIWSYLSRQPLGILVLLLSVLILNGIKFLGFLAFPFDKGIPRRYRSYIWVAVLYIAGVTGSMGASRFAMPVFFFLLLMLEPFLHKIQTSYLKIRSQ